MYTLRDIAEKCNVSTTTVSNVLNGKANVGEKTKQLVWKAVQDLNYQPNPLATGLRGQKTRTIGVVAEDICQFTTPQLLEGVMKYCEENEYRVLIQNLRLYKRWDDKWFTMDREYHDVLNRAVQKLLSLRVDGILHIAGHGRIIHAYEDVSVPVVMAYATASESSKIPSVVLNDYQGSYEMTKYLLSQGHTKIAFLGGRSDNIHTQERLTGYQKALFEAGILYNPDYVIYGNWQLASGYQLAPQLLATGATAIFSIADEMTGGIYRYCYEHGVRIPDDISLASFNDSDFSSFLYPTLTTVSLPLLDIGHKSAQLLLDRIENDQNENGTNEKKIYAMNCIPVIRDSVKKLEHA